MCGGFIREYIQKFPDWVDNEINNNKHSSRSNIKDYGGKTHEADSQNSDTTASSGRVLYHLQFSLEAASPETFGYKLVRYFSPGKCSEMTLRSVTNTSSFRNHPTNLFSMTVDVLTS
jgi:hypothetical protein